MRKRVHFILFFVFLSSTIALPTRAATFFGEIQTGLIELEDFRYPVFIYVPENIKPGSRYPMIISIPDEGETPDEHIKKWTAIAKHMTVIVLTPTYKRLDDLPNAFDRWFFVLKHLMSNVYPVHPKKIYLVGEQSGAEYASYLGVNYPEEFSAVALLEGPLGGKFEKLLSYQTRPIKQIPFLVALKEGKADVVETTEKNAYELEKRGYFVEVRKFPEAEDFTKRDFKENLIKRLEEKNQDWQAVVDQSRKNFSEKMKRRFEEFFTV